MPMVNTKQKLGHSMIQNTWKIIMHTCPGCKYHDFCYYLAQPPLAPLGHVMSLLAIFFPAELCTKQGLWFRSSNIIRWVSSKLQQPGCYWRKVSQGNVDWNPGLSCDETKRSSLGKWDSWHREQKRKISRLVYGRLLPSSLLPCWSHKWAAAGARRQQYPAVLLK